MTKKGHARNPSVKETSNESEGNVDRLQKEGAAKIRASPMGPKALTSALGQTNP